MDGPSPDRARAEAAVHRIHDRYLLEVVEELGLCPFARRSREQGRVHRPILWVDGDRPQPADAAGRLARVVEEAPDAEIVLLTFIEPTLRRFAQPATFDHFVDGVREAWSAGGGPTFFMVGFHPDLGRAVPGETKRPLTADTLVPLIRRSPDPVIQCVEAGVLERARAQAQVVAHERLLQSTAGDPMLRAMIERSIQPDPELSAEIGRHNFSAVGTGDGLAELTRRLEAIRQARDEAYAEAFEREP
jgi:hypothetical protein